MSLWSRLFGKKERPAPRDLRGWNEDWQVGDIAECINPNWVGERACDPGVGDVLTVSGMYEAVGNAGDLCSFLRFKGKPVAMGWHCVAFRKHRPAIAIEQAVERAKQREKVSA